jgi:hypothetical protein
VPAFPEQPLNWRIRIAPGADPTANPSTYTWTDVTTDVDATYEVVCDVGADDDASEENSSLTWVMRNTSGKYTTDNPESTLYPLFDIGCPVEYAIDCGDGVGYVVQCIVFLSDAEDELTANTPYRCITHCIATGRFDALSRPGSSRLTGSDAVLRSAMTRTGLSNRRKAFWPMEDAAGATEAASLAGPNPPLRPLTMAAVAPEFGVESPVAGAASVAKFALGTQLSAPLTTASTATGWRLSFLLYVPTPPAGAVELAEIRCQDGSAARHVLELGPNYLRHRAYDFFGAEISGAGSIGFTAHNDAMVVVDWELTQSTTNIVWLIRETTWTIGTDGAAAGAGGQFTTSWGGTLGRATAVTWAPTAALDEVYIGQGMLTEASFGAGGGFAAVQGWAGETATSRAAGMAAEFGLPSSVTSTALGERMGPQLTDSLLANLRDIKLTDHGVLTDHLGVIGYRALSELYNLTPAITLSAQVRGELGVMAPVRSAQYKVNSASAQRRGGTSFTAEAPEDIAVFGRYEAPSIDINPSRDFVLPGHAGYRLARGLSSRKRYDQLTIDLLRAPQHATAVLALKLGDRIAASSLPPQQAKGGQQWQVRGWTSHVGGDAGPRYPWRVDYRLVAVDAYDTWQWDVDRWDTPSTEILADQTSTGAGLLVQTADTPIAVTGATSIDLNVMGEKVTMTAVANETLTDDGARTVSNGWGDFPATAHAPVRAWNPVVALAPGATSDFSVSAGLLRHSLQAAGSALRSEIGGLVLLNPDVQGDFTYPALPTGASLTAGIQYRIIGGTGYIASVGHLSTGNTVIRLFTPDLVNIAEVPVGYTFVAGTSYTLRISPVGTRHRAMVYPTGSPKTDWDFDLEDSDRVRPGLVAIRSARTAGNTNANPTVATWDNITLNGTQWITTTRSVNGVVKAQPTGGTVKLWRSRGFGV